MTENKNSDLFWFLLGLATGFFLVNIMLMIKMASIVVEK